MTKSRKCTLCREVGHQKPKCPHKERIDKENEKKKQKKIKQREMREKKKKLMGDSRQQMKGRAGSTRNGFVRTYAPFHLPNINPQELIDRNELLGVDPAKCFWCKKTDVEAQDHYIPLCRPKQKMYGVPHPLNIFPSCHICNSNLKGGKSPEEWNKVLKEKLGWGDEEMNQLNTWRETNISKLTLANIHCLYLEENFLIITLFHQIGEMCAKTGKPMSDFITIHTEKLAELKAAAEIADREFEAILLSTPSS